MTQDRSFVSQTLPGSSDQSDALNSKVKQWIRPEIRTLRAYEVPPSENLIKLDAMENPYVWPPSMQADWLEELQSVSLNRYPDASAKPLKSELHSVFSLPEGMDLILGNGSDELIQMITLAVAEPGRCILAPEPSFVMYKMIANFTGMKYVGVPLQADSFDLDIKAMRRAIETHQPAVVYLAYPNNPTGNLFSEGHIREIIELAPGLVVVDEAYVAFAKATFVHALSEYQNLLVMRTLSKMGLAGLRLGYLIGSSAWLEHIEKVRLPYNISTLTQTSAHFALRYKNVLDQQTDTICKDREQMLARLAATDRIKVFPSKANFILIKVPEGLGYRIYQSILEDGILVKNVNHAHPLLQDCLRVTVGRPEENQAFLKSFQAALDSVPATLDLDE